MISEKDFEKEFIKIINENISKKSKSSIKNDFSLVTDIDINVEKTLIKFIIKNFPDIQIISEENPKSHAKSYNLQNKFAIIDPIDGTENYFFTNSNFGSVVSVVYDDFNYHGIYVPNLNQIVSSINIKKYKNKNSSIKLLSTSCLGTDIIKIKNSYQNYRILGSSSYMFFLLLNGSACSYDYCGKAKIWDYYTGLSLSLILKKQFKIYLGKKELKNNLMDLMLNHKSSFKVFSQ